MAENAIISDLEFAPQLTDDMVIAVEDTQNTYSATLGMLRGQLNKIFVEKKDVDFNTLTDDGFYQVSGSLTNQPFAGSIVWLVKVVKDGDIIVQSTTPNDANNYLYSYKRRWNGSNWTSWQNSMKSYIELMYPVGSLFFSTASTCPLQALGIGTWQNVGTSLTLNVNTNAPVKGTGMTLGLTEGVKLGGLIDSSSGILGRMAVYGDNIGTSPSGDTTNFDDNKSLGVTTDSTKSGITATVIRTQITVNVFQRTA